MDELVEYESLASELLKKHNLVDWTFGWDENNRLKSRIGLCDYSKKRVSVTKQFAIKQPNYEVKNIILHEIAHALTEGHGHNKVWKAKCLEIGAMPEPNYRPGSLDRKYKGVCPTCGDTVISYKKKTACSSCYFDNYRNIHMKNGNGIKVNYVYVWEQLF